MLSSLERVELGVLGTVRFSPGATVFHLVLVHWWLMVVEVVVHSVGRVDRERPAVVPEVILPRPRERRRKGSREPMARPTMAMWPAEAEVVLVAEEPVGFIALIMGGFKRIATRAVMEVSVSAIPYLGLQFITVVVEEVGATTTTSLQRIPMD